MAKVIGCCVGAAHILNPFRSRTCATRDLDQNWPTPVPSSLERVRSVRDHVLYCFVSFGQRGFLPIDWIERTGLREIRGTRGLERKREAVKWTFGRVVYNQNSTNPENILYGFELFFRLHKQ